MISVVFTEKRHNLRKFCLECSILMKKNKSWFVCLINWKLTGSGSEAAMIFSCASGHKLHGPPSVHCTILGQWGAEQPSCKCESQSFPSFSKVFSLLSGYLRHSWLRTARPNSWLRTQLWWFCGDKLQTRFPACGQQAKILSRQWHLVWRQAPLSR